jgi:hypothetical protein
MSTSIAAAFPHAIPTAGWAYALLGIVMPLYGRRARRRAEAVILSFAVSAVMLSACSGPPAEPDVERDGTSPADDTRADVERALDTALTGIVQLTDSIDDLLQPVPLLTPAEENALRRYGNDVQLARARSLGARPADSTELAALRSAGRLVELEDSTPLWAVRELDHSAPFVTPDTHARLTRIAQRFQQRLEEMGLPLYRVEVTSVLRTAGAQADLRQTNINAAAGVSTHEFGTTLDLAYSSFAAPHDPQLTFETSAVPWMEQRIDRIAAAMLETAAARKSRELQAVLGKVLLEFQQAGDVLVTLERQQPVFHITVGRPAA